MILPSAVPPAAGSAAGRASALIVAAPGNPSLLAASGFALADTTGALTELGNSPFDVAENALHVTSDPTGKFLFVVNGDGLAASPNTLTVYAIAVDGNLTKVATTPTGPNPWAAAVDPSGKFVYVRCESLISSYGLNADGTLTALTPVAAAAGTGDVLIHPSGTLLFTVGRSSDQLQAFDLNATTGDRKSTRLNSSH